MQVVFSVVIKLHLGLDVEWVENTNLQVYQLSNKRSIIVLFVAYYFPTIV